MKNILIYFCVVLLLLTLLSSLGGSIKIVNEPFIDENPARKINNNNNDNNERYYDDSQESFVGTNTYTPAPVPPEDNVTITENDKLIEPFEETDNTFASV